MGNLDFLDFMQFLLWNRIQNKNQEMHTTKEIL